MPLALWCRWLGHNGSPRPRARIVAENTGSILSIICGCTKVIIGCTKIDVAWYLAPGCVFANWGNARMSHKMQLSCPTDDQGLTTGVDHCSANSWPLECLQLTTAVPEFTTAVLKVDRANYLKLIFLAPALTLFVRCAYSHIWIVDNQLFLFFVICFGPFVSIYKVIFWMSKSFLVASQNWVIHNLPPKTPLKCVTPESKTLGVWYI